MINKLLSENIIESDFYKYNLEIGLPRLLEKIMNVFKSVDKNMTYTWDESNKKSGKEADGLVLLSKEHLYSMEFLIHIHYTGVTTISIRHQNLKLTIRL